MAIATSKQDVIRLGMIKYAVLGTVGSALILSAPVAVADNTSPAPITFAGSKSSSGSKVQYRQYASAPVQSARVQGGSKRVEYRYPDQPNMAYGQNGPRQLSFSAQPMAFSSSKSAVSLGQAQKISGSKLIKRDPALTPGAFDARATAAQIGANVARSTRQAVSNIAQKVSDKHSQSRKVRQRQVMLAAEAPRGYAKQKIGAPYEIQGRWYVPFAEPNYDEVGVGSWYGPKFHGKASAVGETFDQNALTAAHPTLPIPSLARVTNIENGRTVVVRINDRGPFVDDRIIDLSKYAASVLGYKDTGTAKVRVQYMGFAPEAHNTVPAKYVTEAKRTLATDRGRAPKLMNASFKVPRPAPQALPALRAPKPSNSHHLSTGGYLLQLGAFGELSNAHQLRAKLHPYGKVFVKETRINGRDIFKVYLGNLSSRQQATQLKRNLSANGFDALIVSN